MKPKFLVSMIRYDPIEEGFGIAEVNVIRRVKNAGGFCHVLAARRSVRVGSLNGLGLRDTT